MKVALVHDYLVEYGGAERVLEALHEIWPQAPIYTAFVDKDRLGIHKDRFAGWRIRTSWAQKVPFFNKLYSLLRILAPFLWNFDFSGYDVVISSTNMYFAKNINVFSLAEAQAKAGKRPIHICYCHTPPRSLYGYQTSREVGFLGKIYEAVFNPYLRFMDKKSSKKPDYFVANSQEVAGRIKKFYDRDSTVIYPPVSVNQTTDYRLQITAGNYYLVVGRLTGAKRVNLAVEAAEKAGFNLKVVGTGVAENSLRDQSKSKNVEFLGSVSDEELAKLYAGCTAVLFLAKDEDFGIVPVEAMMFGKPVIGAKSGGVVETVTDGKTGVLINEPLTVEKVIGAIKRFEKMKFDSKAIAQYAKKFSKERFIHEIKKFVKLRCKNNK